MIYIAFCYFLQSQFLEVKELALTLATDISDTTVYSEKLEQPMKWKIFWPRAVNREVPSGMTPLPCVALIRPQRLVFGDLQNLQS